MLLWLYDKNKPEFAVHRGMASDSASAYYRLDNNGIFVFGNEYNAIKVTTNGKEGYAPAYWEADIAVVPTEKNITITEALVVNDDEIDLKIEGAEKGFMGYVFTRKDGSI